MRLIVELYVPGVPVGQPRAKATTIGGHTRMFTPLTNKRADGTRTSNGIAEYKTAIRGTAAEQYSGAPLTGPIGLEVLFVFSRPKSKVWKKRPMPREPHTSKPDLDNALKAVKDSLSKQVWRDDAQVSAANCTKAIAAGDEQPHTFIKIYSLAEG
jgi:Holliday junction resolvase RusA-like endonuclease